jgi:diaminopimelate epimerase
MALEFHKMHGAGNDFVLIDARGRDFTLDANRASKLADRHRGIGCDQILVLRKAVSNECVARYEIWNSDGSAAAQCGNGARCVALFLELAGEAASARFSVESPSGTIGMKRCNDGEYELEMGRPDFAPDSIPLTLKSDDGWYRLDSPWGRLEFGSVSVGNPHALILVEDINMPEIPAIGAFLGSHAIFPDGCNIGFAHLEGSDRIRLRVVERGAGETLACGSGACAAMAILQRAGRAGPLLNVFLPGGHLVIKWPERNRPLTMKGPAAHVFKGTMNE